MTISTANISGINFAANAPLVLDVQTSKDQTPASTTIASPAFSTATTNELLLAFVSTDQISPTAVKVNSISGGGLTWTLVQRTNSQGGTAEIWRAFAAAKQTNITVTATISQKVASSMTIVSFENVDATGANGVAAIGATAIIRHNSDDQRYSSDPGLLESDDLRDSAPSLVGIAASAARICSSKNPGRRSAGQDARSNSPH